MITPIHNMPTPPLNIALVGITGYAKSYLESINNTSPETTVLKAITAINRSEHEEVCQKFEANGAEVFTDFDQMIAGWNERIDLCALPVPIHLHLPMTLKAQAAGMNVVLEKPMAGSVEEGLAICKANKDAQRIAIGFQDMYRPSTHKLAQELKQGRIGNVTDVKMLTLWPRPKSYYKRNNWAGQVEVDGYVVRDSPINNATAHFVNFALYLAGVQAGKMAKAETVTAELFRAREIPSFDTAAIRVNTDTGVPLHLYATHSCKDNEISKVIVQGEKGSMTWVQGQYIEWNVEGEIDKIKIESMHDAKEAMWQSVLDALIENKAFCCTPDMAMSHVELVEKLHTEKTIKDLDPEKLVKVTTDKDESVYLPSMADDLKRCFAEKALPSELELDWAL